MKIKKNELTILTCSYSNSRSPKETPRKTQKMTSLRNSSGFVAPAGATTEFTQPLKTVRKRHESTHQHESRWLSHPIFLTAVCASFSLYSPWCLCLGGFDSVRRTPQGGVLLWLASNERQDHAWERQRRGSEGSQQGGISLPRCRHAADGLKNASEKTPTMSETHQEEKMPKLF